MSEFYDWYERGREDRRRHVPRYEPPDMARDSHLRWTKGYDDEDREMQAAQLAYAAGLGVSEWPAFIDRVPSTPGFAGIGGEEGV